MSEYVTPAQVARRYAIQAQSLRNWAKKGLVNFVITAGGHYLYEEAGLKRMLERGHAPSERVCCAYARISPIEDPQRLLVQQTVLSEQCPTHTIFNDVSTCFDWNREGLARLMEQVMRGDVEEIVVTSRDRLGCIGVSLLEQICSYHKTTIRVLEPQSSYPSSDLAEEALTGIRAILARC